MFKLVALEGNSHHALDRPRMTVGRDQSCDIRLVTGKISKQHALLTTENGSIFIEDLNSTNGTFVNNRQIRARRSLTPGDVIRFESIAFYLSPEAEGSPTILAHNLPQSDSASSSSKITIEDDESSLTVFEVDYSLPSDWPTADEDPLFTDRSTRYTADQVDQRLHQFVPTTDEFAAALVVMSNNERTPVFGLKLGASKHHWSIGRSTDQSITLTDMSVSANHATLIYDNGRWAVQDENSSNRVKVNDRTQVLSPLSNGDVITLGKVELVFRSLG
jgi:pSer/pThr/pTyr-binding forkhead associated (FHA) protein